MTMTRGRIAVIVVASLAGLALLVAGGFALYRLGYAQAVTVSTGGEQGLQIWGPLRHMSGYPWSPNLRGWVTPWSHHHGTMVFGFGHPFMWFPWVGGLIGVVLFGGVVALAVIGIMSLIRRSRASQPTEIVTPAKKR